MVRLAFVAFVLFFGNVTLADGLDCMLACSGKPDFSACKSCCTSTGFTCHSDPEATDPNQYSAASTPASNDAPTTPADTSSQGSTQSTSQNSTPVTQPSDRDNALTSRDGNDAQKLVEANEAVRSDRNAYEDAVKKYGANSPQAKQALNALKRGELAARQDQREMRHDERAITRRDGVDRSERIREEHARELNRLEARREQIRREELRRASSREVRLVHPNHVASSPQKPKKRPVKVAARGE